MARTSSTPLASFQDQAELGQQLWFILKISNRVSHLKSNCENAHPLGLCQLLVARHGSVLIKFYLENVANIPQCPSGGRNLAPHSGMLTILPAYILLPLHLNELYIPVHFFGFTEKIRFGREV